MELEEKYSDVGIIVGRFQVPKLTEAHFKLIDTVLKRHKKVIIFLGVSGITPVPSTKRNPLDFETRKQMLEKSFPADSIIISHVRDMKYDGSWSNQLDEKIRDLISPNQSIMLYGGRDSFIHHYKGKYPTQELAPEVYVKMSGSELREQIKVKAESSDMFRAGVIWANENQYKHSIAVIDVAVFNEDYSKILLCRKSYEKQYRFFGGFVDVKDNCYEDTAEREVREEGGIEIKSLRYVTSKKVDDWRFRNEGDKLFTTLFSAVYDSGNITPGDDVVECAWFDFNTKLDLVEEHSNMFNRLWNSHLTPESWRKESEK